jgi:hypothetical protein
MSMKMTQVDWAVALEVRDKGYASKANRQAARKLGIVPVIPAKANEKQKPASFPKTLYKGRARIEQAVGKLKRFKRIALRCDEAQLCLLRRPHRRLHLAQIRPRGLVRRA